MATRPLRLDVDTSGVVAAFAALRRWFGDLSSSWGQAGAKVEQGISPFVPFESGALVDSLRSEAGPAGVSIGSDLIYAGVQDRGWPGHNIAGHHFMDRAAEQLPGAAVAELAPAMQNLIDRAGLR